MESTLFEFNGEVFQVSVDSCTFEGSVIRLPEGAGYVMPEGTDTLPPTIEAVTPVTDEQVVDPKKVFDAVLMEKMYFEAEDRLYSVWMPATAQYYDGSLVRLTDGRALVWGSEQRSLNPPMGDFVPESDARITQAGDRIYRAYPASV